MNQQSGNEARARKAREIWHKRKGEIEFLYHDQKWSQSEVAEHFRVSQAAISKVMANLGLKPRMKANYGKRNGRYKDGTQSRLYRLMIVKDKCSECGATDRLAIHHRNGDHYDDHLENLQILCWSCHNRKTKKLYWDRLKASGASFPMSRTELGTFTAKVVDA